MSVSGQIWATPGSSGTVVSVNIDGSTVKTYTLTSASYTANPGTSGLWKVAWPGYCVVVDYYSFSGGTWNVTGSTISVAGAVGSGGGSLCQMYAPLNAGSIFSGRLGKDIGELAVIGGKFSVCILTGTTANNWQEISQT